MQFREALNEMESMGLSPNHSILNKHVQSTTHRLNIVPQLDMN